MLHLTSSRLESKVRWGEGWFAAWEVHRSHVSPLQHPPWPLTWASSNPAVLAGLVKFTLTTDLTGCYLNEYLLAVRWPLAQIWLAGYG